MNISKLIINELKRFNFVTISIRKLAFYTLGISTSLYVSIVNGLPTGGSVVDGQAGIVTDQNYMQINQSTNSALINWQTFNIGASEHVHFNQPSVNSLTINRINPANGASGIYGSLTATGQIFLLNPAGVIFGNGANVNVAGILASTSDINLDAYYQGRYEFVPNYNYDGSIINNGNISIKDSGYAAFVAPTVINNGVISANLGHVQLSSGDAFSVDLYGDQLINFKLPADKAEQLNRKYKVENNGQIYADGGRILMTSADVNDVVSSVINMDGLAQANSVQEKNGQIIFSAGKNGKLNFASNAKVKASKGAVHARAKDINLANNSEIDVSSDTDVGNAGVVTIGGNYQGLRFYESDYNATSLNFEQGSTIKADAMKEGHGGGVILWSDGITTVGGTITALGGTESGNGGFVETSGKLHLGLLPTVSVDASTQNQFGLNGNWLLDPTDFYIDDAAAIAIRNVLQGGTSVSITTEQIFETAYDSNDPGTTLEVFETTVPIYNCPVWTGVACTGPGVGLIIGTGYHGATSTYATGAGSGGVDADLSVLWGNVYFNNNAEAIAWSSAASFNLNAGGSIYFNVGNAIVSNGTGNIKLFAGLRPETHTDDISIGLIYKDNSILDQAVKSYNGGLVESYIRPHDNFGQPSSYVLFNGDTKTIDQSNNDFQVYQADLTTAASEIYDIGVGSQFIEYHWINYAENQHVGSEARTLSNAATIVSTLNGTNSFDPTIGFALFNNYDLSVVDSSFIGFDEFRGHFDGLGRTLSNFNLTGASSQEGHTGFLQTVNGNQTGGHLQIIKNLNLSNFDIEYTADSSNRDAVYGGGALIGEAMLSSDNPLYISNIEINGSSVVALPYNSGGLDYAFRSSAGLLIGRTDGIGDLRINTITTGNSASNFVDSFYIGSHVVGETSTDNIELSGISVRSNTDAVDISVKIDAVNSITPESNYENGISENSYLGGIIGRTSNPDLILNVGVGGLGLQDGSFDSIEHLNFEISNIFPNQDTFAGGVFGDFIGSQLIFNGNVSVVNLGLINIMQDTGSFVDYGNKGLYLGGFAGRIMRDNDLTNLDTLDVVFRGYNFDRSYIYAQQQSTDFDMLVADNNVGGLAGSIVADNFSIDGFYLLNHVKLSVEGFELGDGFASNVSLGIGSLVANNVNLNNGAFLNDERFFWYSGRIVNSDYFLGLNQTYIDNSAFDNTATVNILTGSLIANIDAQNFTVRTDGITIETLAQYNFNTNNLYDPSSFNVYVSNMIARANVDVIDIQTALQFVVTSSLIAENSTISNHSISTGGVENVYVGNAFGSLLSDNINFNYVSVRSEAVLNVSDNNEYTTPETKNYYLGGLIGHADITNTLVFNDGVSILGNSLFQIKSLSTADVRTQVNYNSYLSSLIASLSDNGSGNLSVDFNNEVYGDVDVYNIVGDGYFDDLFNNGYTPGTAGFDFASYNSYTGIVFGKVNASDISIVNYTSPGTGGGGFTVATTLYDVEFSDNTADINLYNGGLAGQVTAGIFNIGSILQSEATRVVISTDKVINPNSLNIYSGGIVGQASVQDMTFNDTIAFASDIGNDVHLFFNNYDSVFGNTINNNYIGGVIGNFNGNNLYFNSASFNEQFVFNPYYNLFYSDDYTNYEDKTRNVYFGGILGYAEFTGNLEFNYDVNLEEYNQSIISSSVNAGSLTENIYQGGLIGATSTGSNNLFFNGDSIVMSLYSFYEPITFNSFNDILNVYTENSDLSVYLGGLIGQNNANNTYVYSSVNINLGYTNAYSYIENWNTSTNLYSGGVIGYTSPAAYEIAFNGDLDIYFSSGSPMVSTYTENANINSYVGGVFGSANHADTYFNGVVTIGSSDGIKAEIYDENNSANANINTFVGGIAGYINGDNLVFNNDVTINDGVDNYIENNNTDTSYNNINLYVGNIAGRVSLTNDLIFNGMLDLSNTGYGDYYGSITISTFENLNYYAGQAFGYEDVTNVMFNSDIYNKNSYLYSYITTTGEQANVYYGGISGLTMSDNITFANGASLVLDGVGGDVDESGSGLSGVNYINFNLGAMYGATDNPNQVININASVVVNGTVEAYNYANSGILVNNGGLHYNVGGLIGRFNSNSIDLSNVEFNAALYLKTDGTTRVYSDPVNNTNELYLGGLFGQTTSNVNNINFNGPVNINIANGGQEVLNFSTVDANLDVYVGGVFGYNGSVNTAFNDDITLSNINTNNFAVNVNNNLSGDNNVYVGGISGADSVTSLTFNGIVDIQVDITSSVTNSDVSSTTDVDVVTYTGGISGLTTAADVLFDNNVTVASVISNIDLNDETDNQVDSKSYTGGLFGVSNITSSLSQHIDNGIITIGNSGGGSLIESNNFTDATGGLYTGGLFGLLNGSSGITYITSDVNIYADVSSYQNNSFTVADVADKFTTGIYTGGLIGLQTGGLNVIYNNISVNGNVTATSGGISGEAVQAAGGIYGGLVNSSFYYDNITFSFLNNGTTSTSAGFDGGAIGYIDVAEYNPTALAGVVDGELLYDAPNEGANWESGAGLFTYFNLEPCQGPSSDLCRASTITLPPTVGDNPIVLDDILDSLNFDIAKPEVISLTTTCDQMGEALGSACIAKVFGNISDLDVYISIYETITSGNDIVILGYPGLSYTVADGKIDLSKFVLKRYDSELGNNHQSGSYYVLTPIMPPSNN